MSRVPVQERLAFRNRGQMLCVDQPLDGDRAQIIDYVTLVLVQRIGMRGIERQREARRAVK